MKVKGFRFEVLCSLAAILFSNTSAIASNCAHYDSDYRCNPFRKIVSPVDYSNSKAEFAPEISLPLTYTFDNPQPFVRNVTNLYRQKSRQTYVGESKEFETSLVLPVIIAERDEVVWLPPLKQKKISATIRFRAYPVFSRKYSEGVTFPVNYFKVARFAGMEEYASVNLFGDVIITGKSVENGTEVLKTVIPNASLSAIFFPNNTRFLPQKEATLYNTKNVTDSWDSVKFSRYVRFNGFVGYRDGNSGNIDRRSIGRISFPCGAEECHVLIAEASSFGQTVYYGPYGFSAKVVATSGHIKFDGINKTFYSVRGGGALSVDVLNESQTKKLVKAAKSKAKKK